MNLSQHTLPRRANFQIKTRSQFCLLIAMNQNSSAGLIDALPGSTECCRATHTSTLTALKQMKTQGPPPTLHTLIIMSLGFQSESRLFRCALLGCAVRGAATVLLCERCPLCPLPVQFTPLAAIRLLLLLHVGDSRSVSAVHGCHHQLPLCTCMQFETA